MRASDRNRNRGAFVEGGRDSDTVPDPTGRLRQAPGSFRQRDSRNPPGREELGARGTAGAGGAGKPLGRRRPSRRVPGTGDGGRGTGDGVRVARRESASALDDHALVHPEREEPPGRLGRTGEGAPPPTRLHELGAHYDLVPDLGATEMVDQYARPEVGGTLDRGPERAARDDLEEQREPRAREHEGLGVRVTERSGSVRLADGPAPLDHGPDRGEGRVSRASRPERSIELVREVSCKGCSRLPVRSGDPERLGERDEHKPLLCRRQVQLRRARRHRARDGMRWRSR